MSDLKVYMAKFYKDKPLKKTYSFPEWITPIQVGAALTTERVADVLDSTGENISSKNVNYCELTALYWIWKNCLTDSRDTMVKYYGLFHYRRILDLRDSDLKKIAAHNIDVVLPFPTMHEPNISEHHERYIKRTDWEAVLQALEELAPVYYAAYEKVFLREYLYNYNILIARAEVLSEYCEWLFPILARVEALSVPKGSERADRYIGYIGESLLTLYFMYHNRDLKIVHTGRILLT